MRLLQNPWIPLLVQLLQAHTRGQLRFWRLLSPWWDPYRSYKWGHVCLLGSQGRAVQLDGLLTTGNGVCPHCAMIFSLPVLYRDGSPARLASPMWQPELLEELFALLSKESLLPGHPLLRAALLTSKHEREITVLSVTDWCVWESDNTGLKKGCIFFLSWQDMDDFLKKLFHLPIWIREQGESILAGRCCMICWQSRIFSDGALVKNLAANCLLDEKWDASEGRQNTLSYLSELSIYRLVTGWLSPAVWLITVYSKETKFSLSWKNRSKDCVQQNPQTNGTYIVSPWSICLAMTLSWSGSLEVNMQHHVRRRHPVHTPSRTCDCTTAV